jgi:hypothetical protein
MVLDTMMIDIIVAYRIIYYLWGVRRCQLEVGEADDGAVDEMVPIPSWKIKSSTARAMLKIRLRACGR